MRLIDADLLIEEMRKWYWDKEKQKAAENDASPMDLFTHLAITTVQKQPTVKMEDSQDDIVKIIYNTLNHMYCDNCRFSSEIKESDSDEWNCDECHRKYNGWGVSMQESNRIAKEILKQLGE